MARRELAGLLALVALLSGCGEAGGSGFRSTAPEQLVPDEFLAACGKPGTTVEVRAERVTVPHEKCDLRGVTLTHNGAGAVVPGAPGESVSIFQDAPAGGQTQSASVSVNRTSGDVTFSYSAP